VLPVRRLPHDGLEAWAIVQARGYEGLVAKDPRAAYRPGPTTSWRDDELEEGEAAGTGESNGRVRP
jgi:hypothetical protein